MDRFGWEEIGEVPTVFVTEPKQPPPAPIHVGVYQPVKGTRVVALRLVGAGNLEPTVARRLADHLHRAADRAEAP